ncbi:MAG: cupredoxin domain-containing protein [Rubricoccaceae bacterium]
MRFLPLPALTALAVFILTACQTSETEVAVTGPAQAPTTGIAADGPAAGAAFEVSFSASGFRPAAITVPAGQTSTIAFTREDEAPCDGPLTGDAGLGLAPTEIATGQRAEVTVTPEAGVYQVACTETGAALIVEAD